MLARVSIYFSNVLPASSGTTFCFRTHAAREATQNATVKMRPPYDRASDASMGSRLKGKLRFRFIGYQNTTCASLHRTGGSVWVAEDTIRARHQN